MRVPKKSEGRGATSAQRQKLVQIGQGFPVQPFGCIRLPQHRVGNGIVRIQLQRLMALLNSLIELPCQVKLYRQHMADTGGSRIEI